MREHRYDWVLFSARVNRDSRAIMSKGQKPMVGARIDYSWKDQIDSIRQESGKTESEIVREALAAYLGKTDAASIMTMSKRLAALERKYQKLAEMVIS